MAWYTGTYPGINYSQPSGLVPEYTADNIGALCMCDGLMGGWAITFYQFMCMNMPGIKIWHVDGVLGFLFLGGRVVLG